tara:strand:+ start:3348 stop:4196 length:849 start_codon:yes stop_codon:yes gene_type:complete
MDSKEFGLVAAQQLFQIEDIHYGFWDIDEKKDLASWKKAQLKHTQFLFKYINKFIVDKNNSKLLDVGCGIGVTTKKLLDDGFYADGLVPYKWMADYAKNITSKYLKNNKTNIYECKFEDFPLNTNNQKYDLIFFSESYQYVNMKKSFDMIEKILSKNGTVIIFDFFKRDNIEGESPLGGGHSIGSFYNLLKKYNYNINEDIDVTENLSPNLKLVNDIIIDRLIPFSKTLDQFLYSRNKYMYRLIKWIMRKRINKLQFKYSESRNEENFIKYKTYRLIVLSKN